MKKKIIINVTQKDIDKATKLLKTEDVLRVLCCPVALAIHRYKDFKTAAVNMTKIRQGNLLVPTTKEMQIFIMQYDCNYVAYPTKFKLEYEV